MDLSRIPPPVMNWKSSNLPEQWEKFKLHVELIFSGPLKDKPEEDKVSYLLLWIGEEGRQIYKTWPPFAEGSGDEKKLEPHFKRFKAHVQPKLNPIFARYRFNNEIQGSDTIDNFVTRLRIRAQDCEFKEKDNMIRDRIVFGCSSPRVREKLINEGDKLTMDKAIQVVQNFEYCQQQLSSMTISSGTNVDAVNRRSYGAKPPATGQPGASKQGQTGTRRNQKQKNDTCGNCGTVHAKNKCPAYGKICHACGKKNHYIKMCRSSKTVHEIHEPYELYNRNLSGLNRDSSDKDYFIDTVDTVLLLSCFGTGNMEEPEQHPIQLNGQNINNILATHEVVFVNFYADWCRFSNMLTPVFKETGDKIKELFPQPGKVAFAKVDCDKETGISTQYHISKYPTLKLFRGGQIVKKEYRGQRSIDALTEYIKGQLQDTIKKHTTMDELDELEEQKRNVIGCFADENTDSYKTFQRVASQLRDDCQFHSAVGEMTEAERQGSDKVSFRPPKTRRQDQPYQGDLSNYDALLQWTQDKCVPLVREITFENAEELTEEGLPFLILFHKPDDTDVAERFNKAVMEQLLMEKHNVNFLTADGLKFSHPLHHLGKTSNDLPVLAIDSFRHMYIFKHDVKTHIDKPGLLKQFVDDLHSGKLHREFHHGPDPTPTQPAPADPNAKQHIPHDPSEKPEEPTNVPESSFVKLAPSENRYTIVRHRDEL